MCDKQSEMYFESQAKQKRKRKNSLTIQTAAFPYIAAGGWQ